MRTVPTRLRGGAAMSSMSTPNRMARRWMARNTRTGNEVSNAKCQMPESSAFGIRHSALTREPGFTLVELLIVISLISILAAMGLVQYRNSVTSTKESVLRTDLFRMRDAIDQYYADKGKYPSTLDELVSEKYLRSVPVDPFTLSADTWRTILSEPDPTNASASPGVYDVRSGSDQKAL